MDVNIDNFVYIYLDYIKTTSFFFFITNYILFKTMYYNVIMYM